MYLKDECTLDFLINAKDIIFDEKNIKERKSCLNQINEIIKAVGIEKQDVHIIYKKCKLGI